MRKYWRCKHCSATFLDSAQLPAKADERREYSLHQNDPTDSGYRQFLNRLVLPLKEHLGNNLVGLDYGCGPGSAMPLLFSDSGHEIILYDPIFYPDRSKLGRKYDFIVCTEVVEHFHNPFEEFQQLDSLLVPGGWLGLLTCFQTDDQQFEQWHYRRDPTHVVFYRRETFDIISHRFHWEHTIPEKDVVIIRKVS